jgi:hypothetical protein
MQAFALVIDDRSLSLAAIQKMRRNGAANVRERCLFRARRYRSLSFAVLCRVTRRAILIIWVNGPQSWKDLCWTYFEMGVNHC